VLSSQTRKILKKVHIMKTTASIPTKFCTLIKPTKCLSRVVRTHASQIQYCGGRHLEKSKNRHYIGNGLTDHHQIWYGDAHWPSKTCRPSKPCIKKNSRWRKAAILKSEKSRYLVNDLIDYTHFDLLHPMHIPQYCIASETVHFVSII